MASLSVSQVKRVRQSSQVSDNYLTALLGRPLSPFIRLAAEKGHGPSCWRFTIICLRRCGGGFGTLLVQRQGRAGSKLGT